LRYIRASTQAAGTVTDSGSAGITMGCEGLLAATIAAAKPKRCVTQQRLEILRESLQP
jgi:hypothetical protein